MLRYPCSSHGNSHLQQPRPCCCSSHAHAAAVALVAVVCHVLCVPLHTALNPVIQHHPPDTVAMEGERVTIRPLVSGSPPPTVAWYRDGCMVSCDYSHEVKEDGTLILVCAELNQTGEYRFTVSNNAGSVQGQVGGVQCHVT